MDYINIYNKKNPKHEYTKVYNNILTGDF